MRKKHQMKMKELDLLMAREEVTRQQLDENILDMQNSINQQYHEKIYMRVLPQIIKIQNMFRAGVIRTKFRKQVQTFVKILAMFKQFSTYEVRWSFEKFKHHMGRMASLNNYHMRDRLVGRRRREEWLQKRFNQKNNSKQLRFCFVSGIINRFYTKWYANLFNQEPDQPQLNFEDLNDNH